MEKNRVLNHSYLPSLFDATGTQALAFWEFQQVLYKMTEYHMGRTNGTIFTKPPTL